MTDSTSIAPLSVRQRFMIEPELGAGNFLDYALAGQPEPAPCRSSTATTIDHRGGVVLRGHSLLDLGRAARPLRQVVLGQRRTRPASRSASWSAEGLEPAAPLPGADGARRHPGHDQRRDAGRRHGPLPRPRGRGRRRRRRHHPAAIGLPARPADQAPVPRAGRRGAAFDATRPLAGGVPVPARARRRRGADPLLRHHRHPEVDDRSGTAASGTASSRGCCASRPSRTTG